MPETMVNKFENIVAQIPTIGLKVHGERILEHALLNLEDLSKTIKDLPALDPVKSRSAIIISAGPSTNRRNSIRRIKESKYRGTTIVTDGSYVACLKAGLIPDFMLTLDPHPTRMVRWVGDHEFEKHIANDDYFTRQDLNIEFRKNSAQQNEEHIALVNQFGHLTKAIVASTAPRNLVRRLKEAQFDIYWWNPLVDDPTKPDSLTRKMHAVNKLPCLNTGGTVGTAAWVFGNSVLKTPRIGLVGMDFGYHRDNPIEKTQTYYELIEHLGGREELEQCFIEYEFPLTKEKFYTDPTYFWYRKNFLELFTQATTKAYNCTEGGTLIHDRIPCITLDDFIRTYQ